MDIFGDDIDSFLGQGELNENIREDDIDDNEENENGDDKDGEGTGESKKLEPKRRTARKPQVSQILPSNSTKSATLGNILIISTILYSFV